MCRIGLCVFVAVCILLVKKLESMREWKFKEQNAKMWENIAEAKRYSRPSGFNIAGASAPVAPAVPTPLVRRMNEVNARRARLVPGWVTVFGRVYHLGM